MGRVPAAGSGVIGLKSRLLIGLEPRQELYDYTVSVVNTIPTATVTAVAISTMMAISANSGNFPNRRSQGYGWS